jgi:hypothetical protein
MAFPSYLDFDLLIERSGGRCRARVLDSPAGNAVVDFDLPFSREQLEIFVLRAVALGSRRQVRRMQSPDMKEIKSFGGALFDAVFDGEVYSCLRRSLDEAERSGTGLRIRVRLEDAPKPSEVALLSVPWEFFYDEAGVGFLCLSQGSPVVRYPDLPRPTKPLHVGPPLRVLGMVSSPRDYPHLDVEREWAKLEEALADPIQRGLLTLDRMDDATQANLQKRLRRKRYHVFHFIGHGAFDEQAQEGFLLFEGKDGVGDPVSGEFLRALFQNHRDLRLAVLNSCEGARTSPTDPFAGTALSLVKGGVSAVIAMQLEITDEAAITFSSEFYAALTDGLPVDAALAEARTAVFTRVNAVEWAIPVLYLRSPDGRIFDVERTKTEDGIGERVDQLYKDALGFMREGKPGRARETLETIRSLDPGHQEALALLERAREEARLEDLYATATARLETGDLGPALDKLRELLSKKSDYRDVRDLVSEIEHELTGSKRAPEKAEAPSTVLPPSVSLSRASLTVDPSGQVGTEVLVVNEGDEDEAFGLEILGDAAAWGSVRPSRLTVPPKSIGQATVWFRPPAGVPSGSIPFAVRATSESDPDVTGTTEGALWVDAVKKIAADLKLASRSPGSARYALAVSNLGNVPIRAELRAVTRGNAPRVEIDRPVLVIEGGSKATVDLTARLPDPPLVGKRREIRFWVEVEGSGAEPVTVGGRTIQRPAVPAWLAWAGGAALAAALALAVIVVVLGDGSPDGGQGIETYPQAVLNDRPLAFWQFDDPGLEAVDSAPDGSHPGTYAGDNVEVGVDGPFPDSTAVRFGGDSFVRLSEEIPLRGDFTIEAWVLLDGDAPSSDDNVVGTEGCGENLNFFEQKFRLFDPSDDMACSDARLQQGQHDLIVASQPAASGEWTHWVVTRSGSRMDIYRNGERDEDADERSRDPETFRIRALGVGDRQEDQFLLGSLAYVAVYNRALSAEDIRSHFDAAG